MDDQTIRQLIQKYISGTATAEEEKALMQWYQDKSVEENSWISDNPDEEETVRMAMLNNINKQKQKSTRVNYRIWFAAASILIIFAVSTLLIIPKSERLATNKQELILPATQNAVLTLGDGSTVVLDHNKEGFLAIQGKTSVNNSSNGQLIYQPSAENQVNANEVIFNTIKTNRGGQYGIILPDGTKVWLNAASSLKFPTQFIGGERNVELYGEAYFEVTHNAKMPFKVRVNGKQTVKVLGTHFNISAYEDEEFIHTTLLEGSVMVSSGANSALLKPGQEAATNNINGAIKVNAAQLEEAMAWRNGYFIFNNESLVSITRKIARWYNVDFVFKGNANDIYLVGNYNRNKSLTDLLKTIELGEQVKFIVQERRVTVIVK